MAPKVDLWLPSTCAPTRMCTYTCTHTEIISEVLFSASILLSSKSVNLTLDEEQMKNFCKSSSFWSITGGLTCNSFPFWGITGGLTCNSWEWASMPHTEPYKCCGLKCLLFLMLSTFLVVRSDFRKFPRKTFQTKYLGGELNLPAAYQRMDYTGLLQLTEWFQQETSIFLRFWRLAVYNGGVTSWFLLHTSLWLVDRHQCSHLFSCVLISYTIKDANNTANQIASFQLNYLEGWNGAGG